MLLTTSLARGGAETQVVLLAVALRARGWVVHVVSLVADNAFEAELAAAGVEVHSLGIAPGRADLRGAARLAVLLRRVRPAVLHCHMFHANLMGRLARLAFPIPRVISTLHSMAESSRSSADVRWRDRLYRLTDSLADWAVAVCEAVAERHAEAGAVSRSRLRVIPNGVDTQKFRPDPERRANEGFVWLAAGRLMWKKDYPTMLRAAAMLPGCTLRIAGAGPLEEELRALAGQLGVKASFLGAREDLAALMKAADGLVLSSVVEGLPMVLLEAAASGLPSVATAAGGAGEVLTGAQAEFLVPCGDAAALAGAMARLAAMPGESRLELGRAARAGVMARFDLPVVVSRWEELYRED